MKKMRAEIIAILLIAGSLHAKDFNFDNPASEVEIKNEISDSIPQTDKKTEDFLPVRSDADKIVGGVPAQTSEFPFIVSLQHSSYGHFCGGSLIKSDWVLTAAHCVDGITPSYIVAGLYKLNDTSKAEKFKPLKIIKHPSWNSSTMDYDYALIQLNGKSSYPAIKLNSNKLNPPLNLTVAGWGTTSEGGSISNTLLKVTVPLVSKDSCLSAYPGKITDRMICAGYGDGGKDSCQGDSGGPAVFDYNGTRYLAGVVSWGEGCARPNKYGVYSNVASVISWIESTTSSSSSGSSSNSGSSSSDDDIISIWDFLDMW